MVFTGTNRSRPTSIVRAPSKTSIAAPIAVSIWITSGVVGSAGSTCLDVADQRQAEDAVAARRARRCIAAQVEPQVVGRAEPVPVEVGQRLLVRVEGLRGLAQHDPAVGLAAREVAALAVRGRTPHRLDRERRTGRRRTSRRPAASGHRAEVVGVGDEDVAGSRRRSAGRAGRCRAARCRGRRGRADTTRGRGPSGS